MGHMCEAALDKEAETTGSTFDWSLARGWATHEWAAYPWAVCEKAGLTVGPVVFALLFGQQSWLLWQRSRMVLAWALASLRLTLSDLHVRERFPHPCTKRRQSPPQLAG
ncbi:MAG: hypothetical protein PVI63_03530 [Anaerolineae bacterium]|jgi:uncharacterized protein (DUF1501 family)